MNDAFPLCYEASGNPEHACILLIAGIGGQLISWPHAFIQSLVDKGYYVIAYDNRDAGLSRRDENFYTLDDMAADAVLLLDHLKIQKAHIAGFSMGGMIAQLVAINHTDRIKSLTCIATTSGEKGLPAPTSQVQQFFSSSKRNMELTRYDHIKEKNALFKIYNHPDYFDEAAVNNLNERIYDRNHDASGFMRQMMAMAAAKPRTEQLYTLDVPTLILHGDYDPVFSIEHGRQLAGSIKGSQLIEIAKFGHGLPEYFCQLIANYMDDFYRKIN